MTTDESPTTRRPNAAIGMVAAIRDAAGDTASAWHEMRAEIRRVVQAGESALFQSARLTPAALDGILLLVKGAGMVLYAVNDAALCVRRAMPAIAEAIGHEKDIMGAFTVAELDEADDAFNRPSADVD